MKVIDWTAALAQDYTRLDSSLDVAIGFVNSFCHAHTGREVTRNGGFSNVSVSRLEGSFTRTYRLMSTLFHVCSCCANTRSPSLSYCLC